MVTDLGQIIVAEGKYTVSIAGGHRGAGVASVDGKSTTRARLYYLSGGGKRPQLVHGCGKEIKYH
jgi:hypothetical protein